MQTPQKEKGKEKKAEGEEEGESSVKTPINSDHLATAVIENDLRSFKLSVFR